MYHFFSHKLRIGDFLVISVTIIRGRSNNYIKFDLQFWSIEQNFICYLLVKRLEKIHVNVYQKSKLNYTHQLYFQRNIQIVIILSTSQNKDRRPITKVVCFLIIFWWSQIRVCTPSLKYIWTVFRSGLTIGIGALWGNVSHRKIREIIVGSAGVGSCPGLINRCTYGLAKQKSGSHTPATELELIGFWHFPFRDLVWHLSIQVNNGLLADYIAVFDLRRGKSRRFIPFLVYALVYPSISNNLVTLATLSPWSEFFCTHTFSPFLSKALLRWHRTVKTRQLINWQIELNIFGS